MNKIVGVSSGGCGEKNASAANAFESCKYLKVIVSGKDDELTIVSENAEYPFSHGGIAVIPALIPHTVKGCAHGAVTVLIEQPLLPLKSVTIISDVANGGLRSAAEQALYFADTSGCEGVMNALGELIVGYVSFQCAKTDFSPVVSLLREDIERGARDCDYSVEAYIRKLPLNYDYVRKLFKKETGLTPHEYLTAVRMEQAAKILLSGVSNRYSAYTVGQIAEACGYAEPLYFSRVFKKYFGVSPTEYAKRK